MSQHDIEDLVEDSIRSVLASDHDNAAKRRLAARLYRFQYLFDTSDTYGRLKPQLEAIGFVEDQADEPPLPLLDAVAAVIASDDDRTLVHDWVGLLARSIDDGDARDEVPAAFSELAQDASALAIRAAAVRHGVGSMRWGKGLRVRRIPWATYARDYRKPEPAQVDRQYGTRFFADFEPSVDALLVEHATDLQASQARVQAAEAALQDRRDALAQSPLQRLPALVVARNKALTYLGKDERGDIGQRLRFIFRIDGEAGAADGTCYHLLIQHEPDLGHVLMPFIGVQSGTVRSWQGRPLGPSAEDMHFVCDLDALVPQARQDEDRQLAKGRIGWRYKATESETVLGRRLDGLLAFLPDMLIGVQAFYGTPLGEQLDASTPGHMLAERGPRALERGFFVNRVEIMFAFACRAWDKGERPSAKLLAHIGALVDATHESHPLKTAWQDALARSDSGPAFPPLGDVRMAARLWNEVPDWVD